MESPAISDANPHTASARRRFQRAALAGLLVLGAASSEAQVPVRQVLLLQSFNRGSASVDQFTGNFRVELDRRAEGPVNVVQVVVGPTGSVGAPEHAVVDFLRSTFADRPKPDLIVTVAGPAAVFAHTHRQQLFPDTPVLFAAVDQKYLADAPPGDNETAVAVVNDYPRVIENILQLLPQTRQVFMVMGSGPIGQFWHRALENEFRRFHDRLTFHWFDDLTLSELLRRAANLPDNSAIVYVVFSTDAAGAAYADDRVFADLHAAANAPLFAGQSSYLGAGIVGGSLLSIEDLSRDAADVAVQLLNGAPPSSFRRAPIAPGQPAFDWRELQRWGIPESRLPPGSVVRFRAPSLWSAYRGAVLSAAGVLAVQSLLIVGLIYQRRARRKAEIESRRNLALAVDTSRREMMSALAGSMTHDLAQPISSMMCNAEALQMMVAGNGATSEIGEILSDIQSQGIRVEQIMNRHRMMLRSRQQDKTLLNLHAVINETLALVAYDMKVRQISASVHLDPKPCTINGDQVLLQQMLVNLFMNAMDAMAKTPPGRRLVTIRTEVRTADVAVSVCDAGTGLPPDADGTLFTPFVTTKSQGLGIGLTIARTIVSAHGGTIDARNNLNEGATFTVTLPFRDPNPA